MGCVDTWTWPLLLRSLAFSVFCLFLFCVGGDYVHSGCCCFFCFLVFFGGNSGNFVNSWEGAAKCKLFFFVPPYQGWQSTSGRWKGVLPSFSGLKVDQEKRESASSSPGLQCSGGREVPLGQSTPFNRKLALSTKSQQVKGLSVLPQDEKYKDQPRSWLWKAGWIHCLHGHPLSDK